MVQLTNLCYSQMKTFGWRMTPFRRVDQKNKAWNHRKPLKYHRFMSKVDPDELIAHYSRDDIDQLNPYEGRRTYKDAQQTIGRRNHLLSNLSSQDLEINEIFQKELERQRAIIARIEKIRVVIDSQPGKDTELRVNKDLSTPFDCASHIHELLKTRSIVAEVEYEYEAQQNEVATLESDSNSSQMTALDHKSPAAYTKSVYWDMHRPLNGNCRLKFRHFTDPDVFQVNKIYWRSCSFVLGMAIKRAFKDGIKVLLHSWPRPNIKSGSFVYDVALNLSDRWQPTEQELRAFTKIMWEIKNCSLPFERLQVNRDIAREMFKHNPFKLAQVDSIVQNDASQGKVTVYRCGGMLDMSIGPMISNTNQIGRINLAAVHPFDIESESYKGLFYRFQGVSLPQQLPISSYLYQNVLINQAKELNVAAV